MVTDKKVQLEILEEMIFYSNFMDDSKRAAIICFIAGALYGMGNPIKFEYENQKKQFEEMKEIIKSEKAKL